ncbi:MAG: hypothetical protein HYY65_05940, partial [Candidatus Tectomicrobia bacterium]|nr:hypothetical protein [Candidatus Tectomicrobia bacterium]
MFLMAGLGLVVGIPLGFGIHRGGFCMHSASREFLSGTPSPSLFAYLLALGIQLLLVNGLAAEGFFVLGFAIGGLLAAEGLLRPLTLWLLRSAVPFAGPASLPSLLGLRQGWIIGGGLALIALLFRILPRPSSSGTNWSWQRTGIVVGLLGTLAWVAGAPVGWHWG